MKQTIEYEGIMLDVETVNGKLISVHSEHDISSLITVQHKLKIERTSRHTTNVDEDLTPELND